jgi:hypothetical protein
LSTYRAVPQSGHSERELLITERRRNMGTVAKPTYCFGLKTKKVFIQDSTFILSDPGHAKADKPRENEAETRRSKDGRWTKKVVSHILDLNFIA